MTGSFIVYPLSTLIEKRGKKVIQSYLESFNPYRNSDASHFLNEKAIMMENRDLSRTYLAVEPSTNRILGFISLGIKCLSIPEMNLIPDHMLKDMFIDTKTGVVQAFLLAQLARSKDSPSGFGRQLISLAMSVFMQAKALVGCRIVRVDCQDELIAYYQNNGFTQVSVNEDHTLNQMLTYVAPLKI